MDIYKDVAAQTLLKTNIKLMQSSFNILAFLLISYTSFSFQSARALKIQISKTYKKQNLRILDHNDFQLKNSLLNLRNIQYNIDVMIGSNNQSFSLHVDTGSDITWVKAKNSSKDHYSKNQFSCESSITCIDNKKTQTIYYSDGFVTTSKLFTDSLSFFDSMEIKNQSMFMALNSSDSLIFSADGTLGLGLSSKAQGISIPRIIDNLILQKIIDHKSFSIYLSDNSVAEDDISELVFGGFNNNYTTDDFYYFNLVNDFRWTLSVKTISFGDLQLINCKKTVLIDSGTSNIVLDADSWNNLIEFVIKIDPSCKIDNNNGINILTCHNYDQNFEDIVFPDLKIELGDDINHKQFVLNLNKFTQKFEDGRVSFLLINIPNYNSIIFGDVFMRQFYLHFDEENMRIGIASHKNKTISKSKDDLCYSIVLICLIWSAFISMYL